MKKQPSGRLLSRSQETLERDLESGNLRVTEFLLQGLLEIEESVHLSGGEFSKNSYFHEYDQRFNDSLSFINMRFPDFDTRPYVAIYDKIMEIVYRKAGLKQGFEYLDIGLDGLRIEAMREATR